MQSARPHLTILLCVSCTALAYFAVGLPLAVLPEWVSHDLRFSPAIAGFAISVQYAATIISRGMVGPMVDTAGPKRAVLLGFGWSVLSGLVLLAAAWFEAYPALALAILFASRICLGFGESLVGTGAMTWAIARAGSEHTAKIISWNGIATYAAIALGAPAGVLVLHLGGMAAVSVALFGVGLAGWAFARQQPATLAIGADRLSYASVFAKVLPYGLSLGLGAIGFGVITAFVALFYASEGWPAAWIAISAFGGAYVLARLLFIDSIARFGGLTVALTFMAIESAGLLTIWLALSPAMAACGAAVAGFGFALLFPALGMIVVDLVPAQNRGAAIGAYSMFTDVALCVTGPAAGLLAAHGGYPATFLFGGLAALAGVCLVLLLIRKNLVDGAMRASR
jgi:MFS family permease